LLLVIYYYLFIVIATFQFFVTYDILQRRLSWKWSTVQDAAIRTMADW